VRGSRGIYVEIIIHDKIDNLWRLTQDPALHQRWDLRFDSIEYLPKSDPAEPQEFLYETRIGFGLRIKGTGTSVGEFASTKGDTTSSLTFASADLKSLIRQGSGYWRYIPTPGGIRFLTWYDYSVRFGAVGRVVDRLMFRPLMGWATAWSFDSLRLWAEKGQLPEDSLAFSIIHAISRFSIAAIWVWHGLVPKLLYRHMDEQAMLAQAGVPLSLLPWIGAAEILFGVLMIFGWRLRSFFAANIVFMILAVIAVAVNSPGYIKAAFNPVSLNLAVITLSIVGWIASGRVPSSSHCRRSTAKDKV